MKLFFFHQPKAGGTSIHSIFAERYSDEAISPVIEYSITGHSAMRGDYKYYRGYEYYSGHYGFDIFDAVQQGHACITNFRAPVDRVYSLYRYFRGLDVSDQTLKDENFSVVKKAKERSVEEFFFSNDDDIMIYTSNWHTRQLSASPWALRDFDIDQAYVAVDRMKWFYVCEEPEVSMKWLANEFNIASLPMLNVTPTRPNLKEIAPVIDVIQERNQLDLRLYHYGLSRLRALA